jgi:hypothetical protein
MPKPSRNQRRRKKLTERHHRRRRLVPPPQRYTKEQIADAVHHAVCAHSGSDGFGHCRLYAVAGWLLLQHLDYRNVVPQAGRLSLMPDPSDPTLWLEMEPAFGLLAGRDSLLVGDSAWEARSRPARDERGRASCGLPPQFEDALYIFQPARTDGQAARRRLGHRRLHE